TRVVLVVGVRPGPVVALAPGWARRTCRVVVGLVLHPSPVHRTPSGTLEAGSDTPPGSRSGVRRAAGASRNCHTEMTMRCASSQHNRGHVEATTQRTHLGGVRPGDRSEAPASPGAAGAEPGADRPPRRHRVVHLPEVREGGVTPGIAAQPQ